MVRRKRDDAARRARRALAQEVRGSAALLSALVRVHGRPPADVPADLVDAGDGAHA